MTFRIIDTKTGKEPNEHLIYDMAVKGNLIACGIDQFAVCEDGSIILLDDCGNFTYCDSERFKVEREALENQKTLQEKLDGIIEEIEAIKDFEVINGGLYVRQYEVVKILEKDKKQAEEYGKYINKIEKENKE